jgi:hypothetical protein
LEEIFRAHVIQLLVDLDLLPHDRVRLLHLRWTPCFGQRTLEISYGGGDE